MMGTEKLPSEPPMDPVDTITGYLRAGEDVVRCAAARALSAIGDARAAPALVQALLDEDPDVRSDAMAALVRCARPEDADAIRRSLLGDPVKEVKAAAIEALGRLRDGASVPLLRSLSKDRCAHDVAWEDEDGVWDDWLDVQVAAIAALGEMGVADAIDDLLDARIDEMGQELDAVVFAALAKLSDGGIAALLGFLRDRDGRVRQRALAALSKADRRHLAPLSAVLVSDASPDVRRLAIQCFDGDSAALAALALEDPDASVRAAALAVVALSRRDMARAALADPDEDLRAIALEALVAQSVAPDEADLAANVEAWLHTSGPRLAAVCAAVLPRLSGSRAQAALCAVANEKDRPLELRIAALRSLAALASEQTLETLSAAVVDPVRQVRLAALAALAELARAGSPAESVSAREILVRALRGELLRAELTVSEPAGDEGPSVGASKAEEADARPIAITPDGEIVPAGELRETAPDEGQAPGDETEDSFPRSTLASIQAPATALSAANDAPLTADELAHLSDSEGSVRRRRVAVEGPEDIGTDIRLVAQSIAADCPGIEIEAALVETAEAAPPDLRAAAHAALARRAEKIRLAPDHVARLIRGLADSDPVVRGQAAQAVAKGAPDAADHLAALLGDADPVVRSVAVRAVAATRPESAVAGLRDDAPAVRRSALEALLAQGRDDHLDAGLRTCLEAGWRDSLAVACRESKNARHMLMTLLDEHRTDWQRVLVILEALAQTAEGEGREAL